MENNKEKKTRKLRTGKKARRNRRLVIMTGVLAGFVVIFVGAMIVWLFRSSQDLGETALQEEAIFEASMEDIKKGMDRLEHFCNNL